MAQVSANIIDLILLSSIYCIIKQLLQKRSLGIKNEEIIRLLSLFLERATLFSAQCSQYYLYLKYL